MKKIMFSLGILMSFLMSCSNNDNIKNNTSSNERISAVLSEKKYDTQKIMYRMLSKEEKQTLWENKINLLTLDNKLSKQQLELLYSLKSKLTSTLFDENSRNDEKEVFKTIYVKTFIKKAQRLFANNYIYENFYTLSNLRVAPKPDCSCNQGSIYSCSGIPTDCKQADLYCVTTSSGCGALWIFECNGNCYIN